MKHKISVSGIRLYAFHGCLNEESRIGGDYLVDVDITTDFTEAMYSDELSKTIDYVVVNQIVKEEMAIPSKLIEHVAQRILSRLKSEIAHHASYRLTLRKIAPPIEGQVDFVAVSISSD